MRIAAAALGAGRSRGWLADPMASARPRPDDRGMARMSRDLGLQVRMLLTMFLLGLLYVALVAALLAAGTGTATMLVVVAGLALAQLTLSDKLALRAIGAREVSPSEAPGLHAMVERLCVQADLPKPRIAIAPTPVPNAFAMGRSPRSAVVCATTGILELLEPHELEGVMAHELAHVRHRDVLIMTVASFFASIAAMVLQFGVLFGGGRDRDGGQPAFVVVLLVSAVVYAVSFVLMLALSRYREFVADRGAALVTGRPSALASALIKLSEGMARVPQRDLRAAGELNAFFIVPARVKGSIRGLLSTHPPVEQRLAALARLEADLQRPVPART
jgi:heat shock protein HtpX